jgi:hypothetical protein
MGILCTGAGHMPLGSVTAVPEESTAVGKFSN